MTNNKSQGDALAGALRGQTIRIPDLVPYYANWPAPDVNRHYELLVPWIKDLIARMERDPDRVEDYYKQDLAWFIAVWFPNVDFETLKTLSYFVIWLFVWDDAIDMAYGDLAEDLARSNKYRSDTVAVWERYFDEDAPELSPGVEVNSANAIIETFAEEVNKFFNQDQKQRFLNKARDFIASCEVEQKMRLDGEVPGYEDYIALRLNTSAVYTLCALAEFVTGEHIPVDWFNTIVPLIWRETNMGIILINDPLSLKKELKTGCVINGVTALLKPGSTLQKAVEGMVKNLLISIHTFDTGAKAFADDLDDEALRGVFQRYSDTCRSMVIGTLHFSLRSSRYAIKERTKEDRSLEITL